MKHLWVVWGRAAAASVVMIGLASPARATVVGPVYTDRGVWSTSLIGIQTADFEGSLSEGSGTYQTYYTSSGYPFGSPSTIMRFLGETGSGPSYELVRLFEGGQVWLKGPIWTSIINDPRLIINISNAATAFGIDIASSVAGITYEIRIVQANSATENFSVVAPKSTTSSAFFGVRTDDAITRVEIRMSSGQAFNDESRFDNASLGFLASGGGDPPPTPSEVPETSTLLYGAMGLSLLAWTRYRRPQLRAW